MTTTDYGTRRAAIGDVEHLGCVSVGDIIEIRVCDRGRPLTEMRTLTGSMVQDFWQLNSGEVVEWTGRYWRGRIGKFGALTVWVK